MMAKTLNHVIVVAVMALFVSATAQAAVIFSDNFDGVGVVDGQLATAAPLSYTNLFGTDALKVTSSSLAGTGLGIDGSTNGSGITLTTKGVANPTGLGYTLTAVLYATDGSNSSGIGIAGPVTTPFSSSGAFITAQDNGVSVDAWRFDARGLGAASFVDFLANPRDEVVAVTIEINRSTNTVTGSITHSGGTESLSYVFAAGAADSLQRLVYQQQGAGVDIDNVLIVEGVPEPATLGLLALGGLMMVKRQRRVMQ